MNEEPNPRAETGPMEFDFDWPGVFIRGDNAMHFALALRHLLLTAAPDDEYLWGLHELLLSHDVGIKNRSMPVQRASLIKGAELHNWSEDGRRAAEKWRK